MKMRKLLGFSLLVITLLIGIPDFLIADPLDNWHWRNGLPQGNPLRDVAYGNGTFVSVGGNGSIITSSDGVTWTNRTSGISDTLNGVTYGNGTFVAVGGSGSILASPDGAAWTIRSSGISDTLYGVTYGNGTFVAVGGTTTSPYCWGGPILTSPDGVTWTIENSGSDLCIFSVTYGNGTFVAVGGNGKSAGTILISPDGVTWTATILVGTVLSGVTYGNGIFVAVGRSGAILTSPDGMTWTIRTSGTNSDLSGVTCGNGIFVAIGGDTILASPDGVTWTTRTSGTDFYLIRVTYGNGTFVAVGSSGIATSHDGVTWTTILGTVLSGVTYGNGIFVTVGWTHILTSPDGVTWTIRISKPSGTLSGVTYGNSIFVAVGWTDILTSPDGVTWTKGTSGTNSYLTAVTYGNGTFVAVGGSGSSAGTILASPDGVTWTTTILGTVLSGVTYGNGTFVAVGPNGAILTSPDGVTWTIRTSGTNSDLSGVTYGNGTFVAVGGSGTILTSPDGVTWTTRTSETNSDLSGVTYDSGTFVAVGGSGTILTSPDGVTWATRTSGTNSDLNGVTYGNGTFVAVGDFGTILQSDPVTDIPDISVNPTSLNFGELIVGSPSDKQVTVGNDGSADLIIGTVTSPSSPFSIITDNCSEQTLTPNGSCIITYRFSPTSAGTFSSNSNIPSNDPYKNQVAVSLNGVGIAGNITIPTIVATNPSGLQIIVDSSTYTAPHTFDWNPDSSHTLSVASPQSGSSGTRYVYSSWSDGGAQTHAITAPSSSTTYTATFSTQYELTITSSPLDGGTVAPSPMGDQSGTACVTSVGVVCAGYYSSDASVTLTATPSNGYTFTGWSGDLTGTQNPATITMGGPTSITANFSQVNFCSSISISPTSQNFSKEGGSGVVSVTADSNCYWTASTNSGSWDWIAITSGWSGTGSGSVNYTVLPNYTGSSRSGYLTIAGQTFNVNQSGTGASSFLFDYDGDGKTDIAVWSTVENALWTIIRSSDGTTTYTTYGARDDIPVPGDYDGDGKTDIAVWRPSTGIWYIMNSSDGSYTFIQLGGPNDIPLSQ
jgi:uncharacterized repeat protein (TIGR02543 family)